MNRSLRIISTTVLAVAILLAVRIAPALAQEQPSPSDLLKQVNEGLFPSETMEEALPPLRPTEFRTETENLSDDSLSLEQALALALEQHPDLRRALAEVEAQEFAVIASTSPRYPRFTFNSSAGQSASSGQTGGEVLVRTGIQRSYGLGISLNQQIMDFGRTHHRIRANELALAATRMTYLRIRQNVLSAVVDAYFGWLQQAQAVEISRDNVRDARRQLEQAQGFLDAGTGAKIEVIRAEADLGNAEFGLVQAEGNFHRATAALATALGDREIPTLSPVSTSLAVPEWNVDSVRDLAQRMRPDLLAAGLRVAQAEAQVRLAEAEYFPTVTASAGYNWNDSIFPPNVTFYSVGINMSVPILDEPLRSSNVGQAKKNLEAAAAAREIVELQVLQEATDALFTLREALGGSQAAAATLRSSEENYRLAFERYQVGVGNSLEVSEAQRQLIQARSQELQARYGVQTAIGQLLRSTGQIDAESLLPPELRLDPIFELPDQVVPRP